MRSDEYVCLDGLDIASAIQRGDVSKSEVLEAAHVVIATRNPEINAVIDLYDEPVDDPQAEGPFAGVPFLLKDIGAGIAGMRTSCASRALASVPPQLQDDELTRRFKASGLRILGKTNLPELGFNVTTEPVLFGPARNPYNPAHSPGGSSGGAAAAVASGMVPMAHATDGAGSIRIPAACCGLFGLKPSRGLVPQGPAHSDIYGGLVSEGVITRSIRDMSAALTAMAGEDVGRPYAAPAEKPVKRTLHIGVLNESAPDIVIAAAAHQALERAVTDFLALGHQVEPVGTFLDLEDWTLPRQVYLAQVCAQAAVDFPDPAIPEGLEEINRAAIALGRRMTAAQYLTVMRRGHDFARRFAAVWNRFDVLLSPALSDVAPKLGRFPTDHSDVALHVDRMTRLAPHAGVFNLTGGPALVLPVMRSPGGLPIGVQIAGDLGTDCQLLALAAEHEALTAVVATT